MAPLTPKRRAGGPLASAVVLLAFVPGCANFYGYRPVAVQVRDLETKQPLAHAEVRVSYPLADSAFAPPPESATTGDDGVAHLRVAPYGDEGVVLSVTAPGHIANEKAVPTATVRAYEPPHFFEDVQRRPVSLVLELYSEPHPKVELVLPVGFRGIVKAEVQGQDNATCAPGQRLFAGAMQPSGTVLVVGPPLLRAVGANDVRARFADGAPVSATPKSGEMGLWLLSWDGAYHYSFYVGTPEDYDSYTLSVRHPSIPEGRPSNNKGGGRGHGGRHGGSPPTDPGDPPSP
jgi:hypothetical protein